MEQITIGTSGLNDIADRPRHLGDRRLDVGRHRRARVDRDDPIAPLDRGVTLIDTAPVYGFGRSEEIVGKALAEGGLATRCRLATKVGLALAGRQARSAIASRGAIRLEIEDSLRRLRTDVIDLYQVHWPDLETPIEETARR